MPRRCDGESASAQSAATAGVSSPTSCRSRSTPDSRAGPETVRPSAGQADLAPHQGEDLAELVAGLRRALRPVPHRHRPAGGGAEREERRRVGQVGLDVVVDGLHRTGRDGPAVGVAVVHLDPVLPQHLHGHLDVGERRHGLADVAYVDAVLVAGTREQQRRDELRRRARVDGDGAARDGSAARHGEGQGTAAAVVDRDAERGECGEHLPDGTQPHVGVAVEADRAAGESRDRRHEPHDRPGEAAVDVGVAVPRTRGDRPVAVVVLDARAERPAARTP